MGKMNSKDWWLGKTEDQQAAKARLREEFGELREGISLHRQTTAAAGSDKVGDRLAKGLLDQYTAMSIFKDGTFTTTKGIGGVGKESDADRLIGFEHDIDSMRRKSMTGRGVAAMATAGLSLAASNNRGVVYVTVIGEKTGTRTYTTRNPSGTQLTSIRTLKAAADTIIQRADAVAADGAQADVMTQIQRLAELHSAGALTDEEFATKKAELLDRL
jgi:hypothetical protein